LKLLNLTNKQYHQFESQQLENKKRENGLLFSEKFSFFYSDFNKKFINKDDLL
jgi:hypothetical protein